MADETTTAPVEVDPRITKKRLELTSVAYAGKDEDGNDRYHKYEVIDYIDSARPGLIEAAVAAAKAAGWQSVVVSEEFDAGPGGYDGPTAIPASWDHELAGQSFEATPGSEAALALAAGELSAPTALTSPVEVATDTNTEGAAS